MKRSVVRSGAIIGAAAILVGVLARIAFGTLVPDDFSGEPPRIGPDIIVQTGTAGGISYRLITYLTGEATQCVNLDVTDPVPSDGGGCGFKVPAEDPLGINVDGIWPESLAEGTTFVYGPVTSTAVQVRIVFYDGTVLTTAVIPAPPGALSGYFIATTQGMKKVSSVSALGIGGTIIVTENMAED